MISMLCVVGYIAVAITMMGFTRAAWYAEWQDSPALCLLSTFWIIGLPGLIFWKIGTTLGDRIKQAMDHREMTKHKQALELQAADKEIAAALTEGSR